MARSAGEAGKATAGPTAGGGAKQARKPAGASAGSKGKRTAKQAAVVSTAAPAGDAPAEQQPASAPETAGAAAPADGAAAPKDKKKRNTNPGVRVQGGRVYDSENGTTCHQCRQKTVEVKAKCQSCTLYFCPRCLENRYHEKVEEVNQIEGWRCPRCRGECNCSNCRKKAGLEATGILANVAKTAGFACVGALLKKNPHAKALTMAVPKPAAGEAAEDGRPPRPAQRPKRQAASATAAELVEDESLGDRPAPMPAVQRIAVHKAGAAAAAGAGAKRQRGPTWLSGVPDVTELPEGVCAGSLAACLELLHVFSSRLGLRSPSLAALGAELVQPATEDQSALLCTSPSDSLLADVHCRVLEKVRGAWGVPGSVNASAWQGIMRAYYAACHLSDSWRLQAEHGPPAIAGELFTRPAEREQEQDEQQQDVMEVDGQAATAAAAGGAAPAATIDYPAGGYWGVPPGTRVQMLHALLHDALDLYEFRQEIEGAMGGAVEEEKERRSELAEVRRKTKEALKQQRNQQIALLIANSDGRALTLEEQRALMEAARQKAEASTSAASAAKLQALSGRVVLPCVRAHVLGEDRDGHRYVQLQCAGMLSGGAHVLVHSGSDPALSVSAEDAALVPEGETLGCQPDAAALAAALHERGRREGPLRHALALAYKLKLPQAAATATAVPIDGSGTAPGGSGSSSGDDGPAGGSSASGGASQQQQGRAAGAEKRGGTGSGSKGGSGDAGPPAAQEGAEQGTGKQDAKRGGNTAARGRKRGATPAGVACGQEAMGGDAAGNDAAGPAPKRGRRAARSPAAMNSRAAPAARKGRRGKAAASQGDGLPQKVDDLVAAAG